MKYEIGNIFVLLPIIYDLCTKKVASIKVSRHQKLTPDCFEIFGNSLLKFENFGGNTQINFENFGKNCQINFEEAEKSIIFAKKLTYGY